MFAFNACLARASFFIGPTPGLLYFLSPFQALACTCPQEKVTGKSALVTQVLNSLKFPVDLLWLTSPQHLMISHSLKRKRANLIQSKSTPAGQILYDLFMEEQFKLPTGRKRKPMKPVEDEHLKPKKIVKFENNDQEVAIKADIDEAVN